MANNIYPVPVHFPNGLLLNLLITQLPEIWPADLFPVVPTLNGRTTDVVTTGTLELETPRDLTVQENDDALALFQLHDPASQTQAPGLTIAQLPPPSPAGLSVYVRDLDRSVGPGVGTMAYSNGVEWRRFADDAVV
jgi:hypothetical protein